MRQVETFDIFDTVLTRRVGNPRATFLQLGRRLVSKGIIECSAEAFSRQRTAAEVRAFRNAGGLDSSVNLEDIYNEMRSSLGIDNTTHGKLIAEELDLETDLLVPMSNGMKRVAKARSDSHEVAFVSDMYLPGWFLRQTLASHGLIEDHDVLIVSNECRASKASGALWPHVLDELGVEASQVHHTGNDERSDVKSPRKAGIGATHVDTGNLNRYEKLLEEFEFETDGLSSLLAGASRRVRTELEVATSHDREIRDVTAGVITPFLVGNVLWILRQAIESQTEKIFFIARDGQLMLDVARQLGPKIGYAGELAYMYGSRGAWLLPSLTVLDDDQVCSAITLSGDVDDVSLRSVIHRFGVKPADLEPHLSNAGMPESVWDSPLTVERRKLLRETLRTNKHIANTILELAASERALMLEYLDQVGAITSAPIAIVDQGTGSTLFNAISSVLETVGQRPPQAFYFGLRSDAPDQGFGYPETYIRDEVSRAGFLKTPGLLTLVEMACTADHGSVTGYKRVDGRVTAELAEDRNDAVMDWGFELLRETVASTVRELCATPVPLPRHVDLRPASLAAFDAFWTTPTRAEATAWGRYRFEDGWSGDTVSLPIAERQGVGAVVRVQPHRHWWNGGAEALSAPLPRTLLRGRGQAVTLARKVSRRLA